MIVRILGEGQWDVPDGAVDELNRLDDDLTAAVEVGEEAAFTNALALLTGRVRTLGTPLPDDALQPSAAILPPADAGIADVAELLREDGLIPG